MKHMPLGDWLAQIKQTYPELETFSPASSDVISDAEAAVGMLPKELAELLTHSNGLALRSFRLLPAFDRKLYKKTWDSLQRANDVKQTDALGGDADLLARFLAFADIGNGFAFFDRTDGTIWFNESRDEDVVQTSLSFRDFLQTMIQHAE